jgi:zinc transport system permease protein
MDDFVIRALLGGLGVAVVAGPLGSFVVWARMAYFGAAIAHAALLGVALGLLLGVSPTLAVVAVAAMVAVALVALQGQKTVATDTLLGILAHGALAAGLVAIAFMETVRLDLMGTLFGDILALGPGEVAAIWGAALAALAVLAWIWRPLLSLMVHEELARVEGVAVTRVRLIFMLLIAIVVALSIKIVGLLLITGLVIIPAAAARRFAQTPEQMAVLAAAIGCLSVALGIGGSFVWDTPSGPSIVVAATAAFAASRLWPRLRPRPPR